MNLAKWAQAVKERDGWKCQECGATDDLHAHHIKPRAMGGKNTLDNGVTLCNKHHRKMHVGEMSTRNMGSSGDKHVVRGVSAPREWWVETERGARKSGITSLSNFIRIAVDRYIEKSLI